MKITVIGVGAVGGWFGGRLAATGHDVTFVARPGSETLQALRERGLVLGEEDPIRVDAVESLADAPPADVVLLAVKVTGGEAAATLLEGIDGQALVACTQNAVEVPSAVAGVVGTQRTLPGVVRGFFHHTGPAKVAFHGGPISYTFGTWDGGASGVVKQFSRALQEAGIEGVVHPDIFVDVWSKAMFVGPFGGLGALSGRPLGVLRTDMRGTLQAVVAEVDAVARASGVNLPADAVEQVMSFADAMPAGATSSMQRDLGAGRASELDAQIGAIVRAGERLGVSTPLHGLLFDTLRYGRQA
ncbi:2-dehydropantoate 2-reductase [Corynebacterium guangdongense]|uniref:2-dehydropantoate 2-reductase n=1 Tax=Corynebacterium guangdongense TaxID=1783348 RepID=A0ABU1ZVP1_9CORY|nr:2-dehydropantoate 2-reductase [Corynebacterium guangdongense]MDR7329001.1 2-dehydropantoate 2-reductase [Corynebacterium guangdongense]WJZ17571.1 2-dehydropantoate 2-reductase [Corynebacterium guangdongense]